MSISSTHMNTTIALRRVSTPTQPIVNRIAESTRNGVALMSGASLVVGVAALGARSSAAHRRCDLAMSLARRRRRTDAAGREHARDRGLRRGAVGQQRRGVDGVVPGEDAGGGSGPRCLPCSA